MSRKTISIGMVGYGLMGKTHSFAYRNVNYFFKTNYTPIMKSITGRDYAAVTEAAKIYGWESCEKSYKDLINRSNIDVIDIITPPYLHHEIALAAAKAGKHIICEKPLSNTLTEAKDMYEAVLSSKVKHMMCFIYRKVPAIAFCKKLISEGQLGEIRHFRSVYLCDDNIDPDSPMTWRQDKRIAGSGALGDIASHIIDTARYLIGEIDEVVAIQETFIKSKKSARRVGDFPISYEATNKVVEVTADDASIFLARFKNGALGSFEATTQATGRKNSFRTEINGSAGSIFFDAEDLNTLWYFNGKDPKDISGFRRIQVNDNMHPYMQAWWPAGHNIGYENTFVHLIYDFLKSFDEENMPSPNFKDGFECQKVMDAVEKSANGKKWVKI